MTVAGSCQCGKVTFTVDSETPVPFMYCFCSKQTILAWHEQHGLRRTSVGRARP